MVHRAAVLGWAKGEVKADRIDKGRENGLFVRNDNSKAKLWRISANMLRQFTHLEYARLQNFPDNWIFTGNNQRDIQLQIGKVVPVVFAKKIAMFIRHGLEAIDVKRELPVEDSSTLFEF